MGIKGLLQALGSVTDAVHVRDFAGRTVAIDGYAWLHRAVYGCAQELATGAETSAHVRYFEHRVGLLLHHGVVPLVVFDGANLPAKAATEALRAAARAEALRGAREAQARGDREAAFTLFQRAVDVTPAMAHRVIARLRALRVQFLVAPYEADAQLGFLAREGIVHAVLSEDSDMLPYGVDVALYKLDKDGGAKQVLRRRLAECEEMSLRNFRCDLVRRRRAWRHLPVLLAASGARRSRL
jgi:exonuclease-1